MLTTLSTVFKRAPSLVERQTGKIGSLRTACKENSPVESGTPVPVEGARSDGETGSLALKEAASAAE